MAKRYFGPALFTFLRELRENNNRNWFQVNKGRYEAAVRDPFLQFITDFEPHLAKISANYVADARPTGGSLFRIYRDTRFAKDKSPYKTVAAAHFSHKKADSGPAPSFYLYLEPGNVFAGAGVWHPDAATVNRIRDAIVDDGEGWRQASLCQAFKGMHLFAGETLKTPPRGYDPNHRFIEDLKRKDFAMVVPLTEQEACTATFMDRFTQAAQAVAPLAHFLTDALGLAW